MEELSRIIADFYICKNYISEKDKEIYIYGFKLIIADIVNFSIVLLLGLFLKKIFESIAFLVTLCTVRQFSGGFHAKTFTVCRISMIITFIFVLVLSSVLEKVDFAGLVALINTVNTIIIYILSPVENSNKTLTEQQKSDNKNKACISSFILSIISIFLYIMDYNEGIIISITLAAVVMLMFIAIFTQEGVKKNVQESA